MKISNNKRDSSIGEYKDFAGEDSFVEVTEWANGEGYVIQIGENKHISLTHSDIDAFLAVYFSHKL